MSQFKASQVGLIPLGKIDREIVEELLAQCEKCEEGRYEGIKNNAQALLRDGRLTTPFSVLSGFKSSLFRKKLAQSSA